MLSDFIVPYSWGASFITTFPVWPMYSSIGASHPHLSSFDVDQRSSSDFCIVLGQQELRVFPGYATLQVLSMGVLCRLAYIKFFSGSRI
jgi:hypothetical protein